MNINQIEPRVQQFVETFLGSSYWGVKLTMILSLFILVTSFPDYHWYKQNYPEHIFVKGINWQIEHPLEPLPESMTALPYGEKTGPSKNLEKRNARILIPLLGYLLNIEMSGILIIQHFITLLLLFLIIQMLERILNNRVQVFYCSLALCSIFFCKWGFYDPYNFDVFPFFFLVLSMRFKNPFLTYLFVLCAALADERGLLASSLVGLWWIFKKDKLSAPISWELIKNSNFMALCLSWVSYLFLRFIVFQRIGLASDLSDIGLEPLLHNYKLMPLSLVLNWEGWWIIVAAMIGYMIQMKHYQFLILYLGLISLLFLGSFMVYDVSRSLAYSFPALIIALSVLVKFYPPPTLKILLFRVAMVCLLFPTYGVFFDGVFWLSPIFPKLLKLL